MDVLKCGHCKWVYIVEHTRRCPNCNTNKPPEQFDSPEIAQSELGFQTEWQFLKFKQFERDLQAQIATPPCCIEGKASNGWRHNDRCKNHVVFY